MRVSLISHVTSNRTRRNGLRLCWWRFKLDVSKSLREWSGAGMSSSMHGGVTDQKTSKKHVDVVLRDMV